MAYMNNFNIDKIILTSVLFIIHTLYEIKDYYMNYIYKGPENKFWSKDNSLYNSIGDTIIFILGMLFAIDKKHTITSVICTLVIFTYFAIILKLELD